MAFPFLSKIPKPVKEELVGLSVVKGDPASEIFTWGGSVILVCVIEVVNLLECLA